MGATSPVNFVKGVMLAPKNSSGVWIMGSGLRDYETSNLDVGMIAQSISGKTHNS
jgi:hypothetical protein